MAMKLQEAIGLSEKLASDLTAHRGTWQNYLLTAARVYKYSFHEQLMIYGQRPNATACAEIELWNDRMGRAGQPRHLWYCPDRAAAAVNPVCVMFSMWQIHT